MLGGDPGFFPRVGEEETPAAIVKALVDQCFDLAHVLRGTPDTYLDLPIDDLPFYIDAANRLTKRLKDNG